MQRRDNDSEGYTVWCANCGAIGPNHLTEQLADTMWNTRPIEDKLLSQLAARDALIERLVEAVENIRDLARTGTAPDAFGFTSEAQWNEYKVIKIARESNALVSEYQAMKGGDE